MASEKQNHANRANAQKSTGPRTEAGKNKARFNARRHGLTGLIFALSQDDEKAYREIEKGYLATFQPVGEVEKQLVGLISRGYWRLSAAAADEQNMLSLRHEDFAETTDAPNPEFHAASVRARIALEDDYTNVPLYEGRLRRVIQGYEKRLQDLQATRRAAEAEAIEDAELFLKLALMDQQAVEITAAPARIGFVFTEPRLTTQLQQKLTRDRAKFYEANNWDRSRTYRWHNLSIPKAQ